MRFYLGICLSVLLAGSCATLKGLALDDCAVVAQAAMDAGQKAGHIVEANRAVGRGYAVVAFNPATLQVHVTFFPNTERGVRDVLADPPATRIGSCLQPSGDVTDVYEQTFQLGADGRGPL